MPPSFAAPPPAPPVPPPLITPPPPPAPRRGRGWMMFALILLALLGISLFLNLGQFASRVLRIDSSRSGTYGPKLDEVVMEDNDASAKIAVIDINGIISDQEIDQNGYTMVDLIKSQLDRAAKDNKVKAVIIRMDSPGGEVLASDDIYRAISDFQSDTDKPVVTSMGALAASGGYYISVGSSWIVANELTLTGSIGVILHSWNYRNLMDKVGLLPEVYKSGKFKDMLSGERKPADITPEEREMVQNLINETYTRFKQVVQEGRGNAVKFTEDARPLAPDWKDYADGRVLSGKQAYDLGFVDQLGGFDDAVEAAKDLASITNEVNLVQYRQRYDLGDVLRLFGKTEKSAVVKVDLGMEAPKLQAGRLYFLSPTYLH